MAASCGELLAEVGPLHTDILSQTRVILFKGEQLHPVLLSIFNNSLALQQKQGERVTKKDQKTNRFFFDEGETTFDCATFALRWKERNHRFDIFQNIDVPYSRMSTIQRIGNTSYLGEIYLLTDCCRERTG